MASPRQVKDIKRSPVIVFSLQLPWISGTKGFTNKLPVTKTKQKKRLGISGKVTLHQRRQFSVMIRHYFGGKITILWVPNSSLQAVSFSIHHANMKRHNDQSSGTMCKTTSLLLPHHPHNLNPLLFNLKLVSVSQR